MHGDQRAKKADTQSVGEQKPLEFDWVYFIGRTKLGFTETEIDQMYLGRFMDFLNIYIRQFEKKTEEPKEKTVSSLEVL